jgi:hypothetical protein
MIPNILPEKIEFVDMKTAENDYAELFVAYKEAIADLNSESEEGARIWKKRVEKGFRIQEEEIAKQKEKIDELEKNVHGVNEHLIKMSKQLEKANTSIAEYNLLCSQKNFPIQQQYSKMGDDGHSRRDPKPPTIIPYWLAEEAYKYYSEKFGTSQSLDRLAERGGFGRSELLMLLRKQIV